MEKVEKCLVCGSDNFVHLFQCKDFFLTNEVFSISQCKKCGFRFTDPRPEQNESVRYYNSSEYISHSEKPEKLIDKIYYRVRKYTLNKKYKLVSKYKSGKTLLDIGCGTGEFLSLFKSNNWEVSGIETNKTAREIAKSKNKIEVFDEDHFNQFSDNQFDVITMWHVLEHVYEIDFQLNQIKRILKSDGILLIAVPNSDSFDAQLYKQHWAAYDVPRHLYHFTKGTVNELLSKYDFALIHLLPMKFDAFYISMISEKYKSGKSNYISSFFHGLRSNIYARKNNNYSSLIYIFKKKT